MAGITFTDYVPTSLVGVNSPSPTLAAESLTGLQIPTGAFPGNTFFLTEQQANQLSLTPINGAAPLLCHQGWYMVVQVAATAVAASIAAGLVGSQAALTSTSNSVPPQSIVTDAISGSTAIGIGQNPVVFLNSVTPGNYTIVQVGGDATLQTTVVTTLGEALGYSTAAAPAAGRVLSTTGGANNTVGLAEQAVAAPAGALTLTAAAAASGGTTAYTGTITGGAANAFVGQTFTVAGFDLTANNGTFIATASTATVLTLANPAGVADTHAGTATGVSVAVRVNVSFPYGAV